MSLIGDALRKTRQEAAERENHRRGLLFSAKIGNPPARSNLGLGLALGALIAVAATAAGGGAVWWLLSRSESTQADVSETVPSVAPETTETDEPSSGSDLPSPTGPDSPAQSPPAAAIPSVSTAGPGPTDLGPDQPPAKPAAKVEAPTKNASEDNVFEGGFAGTEDGADVYILEAKLGKVRLSLDYIIFRPDDPFAEINGVELHLGGVIEGYRVKAIEPDRVRLSNGRKDIVIRTP